SARGSSRWGMTARSDSEIMARICSCWSAGKEQVIYMVKQTLKIEEPLETDAADALALALTHFYRINRAF
ncbi:MAG TPA: hypothetical protein EYP81_01860, partial [Thermodesulfobacteriaceae bacterium]|nr:hypothetical protein [Thermodesulfobacteriaceae bacterium]